MYLKVPRFRENGIVRDATVQQVVEALGDLVTEHDLTVDLDIDHPCSAVFVEFPESATYFGSYIEVLNHLEDAGFEVG